MPETLLQPQTSYKVFILPDVIKELGFVAGFIFGRLMIKTNCGLHSGLLSNSELLINLNIKNKHTIIKAKNVLKEIGLIFLLNEDNPRGYEYGINIHHDLYKKVMGEQARTETELTIPEWCQKNVEKPSSNSDNTSPSSDHTSLHGDDTSLDSDHTSLVTKRHPITIYNINNTNITNTDLTKEKKKKRKEKKKNEDKNYSDAIAETAEVKSNAVTVVSSFELQAMSENDSDIQALQAEILPAQTNKARPSSKDEVIAYFTACKERKIKEYPCLQNYDPSLEAETFLNSCITNGWKHRVGGKMEPILIWKSHANTFVQNWIRWNKDSKSCKQSKQDSFFDVFNSFK